MTPALYHFHAARLRRMLRDLGVQPSALIVDGNGFAIRDGVSNAAITVALGNETLAEGLLSAVKLADAAVRGELP